ncbi:MAG: nucleotidyltransferase family protein [Deltaproteobacteria bacterium]|nr:nucleotidyltransferase family protein [Deltaproteobacteria bacterium]
MASLLFLRVREAGLQGSLPRDENARLFKFFSNTLRHTLRLLDAAEEISAALHKRGIDSLLLKGGAHVLTVYKDPGARPMKDVDLLVRRDTFRDAVRIALDLGYAISPPRLDETIVDSVLLAKGDVFVDLHERLTHRLENDTDLSPFFARSVTSPDGGQGSPAFRIVAPEDAALHAVLHIVHHGFSLRLIAYADLVRLLSIPTFRWPVLLDEIERFRLCGIAFVILDVLDRNLGSNFGRQRRLNGRSFLTEKLVSRIVNRETGRLKVELPDKWRYVFIVRPLLDGLAPSARWFLRRLIARLDPDRRPHG